MRRLLTVSLVLTGCCAIAATTAAAKPSAFATQSKPMLAQVRILAISSSSRQNFAGNQDVYLADIEVKGGPHQFARLIDQFPGFGLPIRGSVLRNGTLLKMKLTREPECDVQGSTIYLSPGASAVFEGSVRDSLASHEADMVPCFKSLHQTIAIAGK